MKTTIVHDSLNVHFTNDFVEIKDNTIISQSSFIIEHKEHEPIQVDYFRTGKRIVIEQDPYKKALRRIAD